MAHVNIHSSYYTYKKSNCLLSANFKAVPLLVYETYQEQIKSERNGDFNFPSTGIQSSTID